MPGQDDTPAFCYQKWCFVNETVCQHSLKSMARSSLFHNLYYSYETCDSKDTWSEYSVEQGLRGRKLRASLMATWYPYAFGYDENGTLLPDWTEGMQIVGKRHGMVPEFLETLAESAGFEFQWMSVTAASTAKYGSWSGCMNDVGTGYLDICVQIMYATPDRAKKTLFTIPYEHDRAYMVIPKPKPDESLHKKMFRIFEPFSASLWAMTLGISAFMGLLYYNIGPEVGRRPSTFGDDDIGPSIVKRVTLGLWQVASGIYLGFYELIAGNPLHNPLEENTARRFAMLGWQSFILMFATTYLANLASVLSQREVVIPYANIKECIDGGCNFCTYDHGPTNEQLRLYYPTLNIVQNKTKAWDTLARKSGGRDFYLFGNVGKEESEQNPKCDATWSYSFAAHDIQEKYNDGLLCDQVVTVDPPTHSLPLAFPINPSYAAAMNHHIQKAVFSGKWQEVVERYTPHKPCGEWILNTQSLELEGSDVMTPANLLGVTLILVIFVLLAVFTICVKKWRQWWEKNKSCEGSTCEDPTEEAGEEAGA